MTDLIDNWPASQERILSLQTSRKLAQETAFCVHPDHNHLNHLTQLVQNFHLPHPPRFLNQVHGNEIIEYQQQPQADFQYEADACFTKVKGVICAVMTADCLPVLLTDIDGTFVAAVHCGWRSLYADILTLTLAKINPQHEVLAWFGPCIQQAQYEVSMDFVTNYLAKHPDCKAAFTPMKNGKSKADLCHMAAQQLQNNNVTQISKYDKCTYLSHNYYSWRQDQTPHRMGSMIWLNL